MFYDLNMYNHIKIFSDVLLVLGYSTTSVYCAQQSYDMNIPVIKFIVSILDHTFVCF